MKRASVTQAKNSLSALLNRVRHGESILIEDRGVPVALITPVVRPSGGRDRDRLTRLERQGVVRPPLSSTPSARLMTTPPRPARPVSLSELVIVDRRSGW